MNELVVREIQSRLDWIENEHNVKVLYACEAGSRAWGFESIDSDYDIRFIYARPIDHYLRINEGPDTIENSGRETVIDISGWDLKKALQLFKKSNPALMEWIQSPIIYRKTFFIGRLKEMVKDYYSPRASMYHYIHMAEGNFREYLQGEEVRVKKYFYVLRPIMACIWIERELGIVPVEFRRLMDGVLEDGQLRDEVTRLLEMKRNGEELKTGKRNEFISAFIERELIRIERNKCGVANNKGYDPLNKLFLETLKEL